MKKQLTAKEILQAARDLIADPSRWSKKSLARNSQGISTCPWDATAVSFCAIGACQRVGNISRKDFGMMLLSEYEKSQNILVKAAGNVNPAFVNDHYGHAKTLIMFDRAIQIADNEVL